MVMMACNHDQAIILAAGCLQLETGVSKYLDAVLVMACKHIGAITLTAGCLL